MSAGRESPVGARRKTYKVRRLSARNGDGGCITWRRSQRAGASPPCADKHGALCTRVSGCMCTRTQCGSRSCDQIATSRPKVGLSAAKPPADEGRATRNFQSRAVVLFVSDRRATIQGRLQREFSRRRRHPTDHGRAVAASPPDASRHAPPAACRSRRACKSASSPGARDRASPG